LIGVFFGLSFYSLNLVLNSTPFIIAAVILYILKDRIKDGVKNLSAKLAFRWLPDYTIRILTPDGTTQLGVLKEFFTFLSPTQVPREIWNARNIELHSTLDQAKRLEEPLYYRKEVTLYETNQGLKKLNDIFRLNISRFLLKASDPYKEGLMLDSETGELNKVMLPKVYHLNMIIRQTFINRLHEEKVILKKYRLILDKAGIKRLEKIESRVRMSTVQQA